MPRMPSEANMVDPAVNTQARPSASLGANVVVPGALRMGATHGGYCVGCCWALMAVLVAVGTMNLAWMVAFAALIFVEKNARPGERIALVAGAGLAALGALLLIYPSSIHKLS